MATYEKNVSYDMNHNTIFELGDDGAGLAGREDQIGMCLTQTI
jgi:hypothetical protein